MTNGGDFDETRFVVHALARSQVFVEGYDGTIDSLENGIGQSFKFSPG